ncbi:translocation and assembly module lipoprotein TamL [Salibacter halophilus]|uniref:BamA/TamA family outer membrane protein n=1 Tax=Salibacter halophilus TaxID=1803916 RepID=A0A6N6MBX0_9FLAO|nr:BamA/TamA family outer membrane protein [Salibacter halophilus]KAB1066023.1 BamA/TamA family outer membrane protein [Salibacter halophilus]
MGLNYYVKYTLLAIALTIALGACNSTKYVPQDKYLLVKNELKNNAKTVDEDEIKAVIKQKPNKKIFELFRFNLFVYNLFDSAKVAKRNERKRKRLEKRNDRRVEKGKEPKEFNPVLSHRIKYKIGNAPVVFDSIFMNKSVTDLSLFLKNNGYFNNRVSAKPVRDTNSRKVTVQYEIKAGKPYKIKEVAYSIDDKDLLPAIKKATKETSLRNGAIFSLEEIDDERQRLTKSMRDQGYYYFNQNFVTYEVDSTIGNHRVYIRQKVNNPVTEERLPSGEDTLVEKMHQKYRVQNVYINTNYSTEFQSVTNDTVKYDDLYFVNTKKSNYKPRVLADAIYIAPNEFYSQSRQEYTYDRLSSLNNFRFINIQFEEAGNDTALLNCYINLTPILRQSVSAEAEGTNTGGNLGVSGNLGYTNRNLFKGAEMFRVRLRGGVEAQQTNNPVEGDQETQGSNLERISPFNTTEYGIETSLYLPDLLLPKNVYRYELPNYKNPKTNVNLNFNYQRRPDFTRNLINTSYAYFWSGNTKNSNDYAFYPLNLSIIRIDKRDYFDQRLRDLQNPFLLNTYSDHLIAGSKFNYTWTNQNLRKNQNAIWNRVTVETAGNLLAQSSDWLGLNKTNGEYYELFGIRYAQFVKVANDFRVYNNITKNSKMAYRFHAGVGVPYGNRNVLPYDKSFFAGGANDIRAWTARSLGPGSTPDSVTAGIDQVGDVLLEANVEYRAQLTDMFEIAFFADMGNIWVLERDQQVESSIFRFDRFYEEIAVGTGIGFRFDFSFLLLRLDWGVQMRDPALAEGERWIFQSKDLYNEANQNNYNMRSTFNLGIGYPF